MSVTNQAIVQSFLVYKAQGLLACSGVNRGEALSFASELVLEDVYELASNHRLLNLSLSPTSATRLSVVPASEIGTPGATVCIDSCLTFMTPQGTTTEVLILVEVDLNGDVEEIYALPLSPLVPREEYTLVGIDAETAHEKFASIGCVSFVGGTMITLETGAQKRIEDLEVGDRVLTRDDGAQEIRWIGHRTVRATGEFAPVRILAGTLNNENDLIVSPDHRLFIYQRDDKIGAGRSELLVRVRHLINGESVKQLQGGFVDYFQLLFDTHQIIYAEGIAAETMQVNTHSHATLPPKMHETLTKILPGHQEGRHHEFEVPESLLKDPQTVIQLKRASRG